MSYNKHSISLKIKKWWRGRRPLAISHCSHGEQVGRSTLSRPGPRTVRPPPTLSRHWQRGVVLPQDPLELFGVPLLIVRTSPEIRPSGPEQLPSPDHYGCGLGRERFTGTLAAVEKYEGGCTHWLHCLISEGLQSDILCDEDELALPLQDIVEPFQHPLSVLQKACRHALASPLLVASDEMPPLELANRHPALSQKLPKSKQPIPPAAPASAPPISSAVRAPKPSIFPRK